MNDTMKNLLLKSMVGNAQPNGNTDEMPAFLVGLLERFGLAPEKIKAQLTEITDAIGARLQGIDDKLARIEAKLDAQAQENLALRMALDPSFVPPIPELTDCTCQYEKPCRIPSHND